ncbi:RagB/SusD family nutrient uptake outer membrane protein [Arachidicoccus ginsenosidivorans]|uniref:RagB/SusD family nutrient uptake outer membrane protein n=1 Tax=Arachidicoccus ginsenosidivorans TaxID=496057 RepID=A0A5B8VPV8_9BACT|nr:RagB/SusD family nutrient uptake outer membrane protein [Arachidicoccus ginsenosidivorans]QEC72298.1 RagB/SusD family nutrient uptake outer membrane protein [Arachidicoccus ginsenosidivorans]
MKQLNIFILITILLGSGCKKYLDKKPDKKLVTPSTLADLQALMDNSNYMNIYGWGLGETSADDYYLTYADWETMDDAERRSYIWGEDVTPGTTNDWSLIYNTIYTTNVVLDHITKINLQNSTELDRNNVKGEALFYRSLEFFRLAVNYANAYDDKTAPIDLGIPLRISSDFNIKSTRATVKETYDQIISDLLKAIPILTPYPAHVLRPSKGAAYALLARVYLSMRNYDKAGIYADSSLQLNSKLLDYNDLNSNIKYSVPAYNVETIFYVTGGSGPILNFWAKIDSNLYQSYSTNDLRKSIFFKENSDGSHAFYGNYSGKLNYFQGLATDEQYLIRAESLARSNKISEAMTILNNLLIKRWKTGTFMPYQAKDSEEAISTILKERRKELVMRDLRWQDIKRLNKEDANITLKRILNGQEYELPPNSPRFALPFPTYVIEMTGMQQNPR